MNFIRTYAKKISARRHSSKPEVADGPASSGIVRMGTVTTLTQGGGKTFEDNGAAYQRG